jgi:sec-independent protein translocase protein TatA
MFGMGPMELMIIGCIAVLLFGSKLPEVARSLGGSYREFKKGLNEFQSATQYDEPHNSSSSGSPSYDYDEYDDSATAPRFEPPPSDEGEESSAEESSAEESSAEDSPAEDAPAAGGDEAGGDEAPAASESPEATSGTDSATTDSAETSEPKS